MNLSSKKGSTRADQKLLSNINLSIFHYLMGVSANTQSKQSRSRTTMEGLLSLVVQEHQRIVVLGYFNDILVSH